MNKRITIVISSFLLIICLFLFFITHFFSSSLIAQDGYYVSGNALEKELMSDKRSVKTSNIILSKMKKEDNIYQNVGKYYVGNDHYKKEVNVRYPIFTNNGLAIVNLSSNNKLLNL